MAQEASSDELGLEQPEVRVTFEGMVTWLDEAPVLGDSVKFEVHGYVRRTGREWTEKEKVREFVTIKVTDVDVLG